MDAPDYIEVLSDDKDRAKRIPLRTDAGRLRGFHDDERMIAWGYWEDGSLMYAQDTIAGKAIWPPKRQDLPYEGRHNDLTVYFIQAQTGQIKIGIAASPELRLRALQTGSPVTLALLATRSGGRPKEAEYHARFAVHRLHGEWFSPHPDILAEIEHLAPDQAAFAMRRL